MIYKYLIFWNKNKFFISIFFLITLHLHSQDRRIKELQKSYNISIELHKDFNNDGTEDDLYILTNNKESSIDDENIIKQKLLIIFKKDNTVLYYENDNIFPCKGCSGKSDAEIENITFHNNLLSYTTCIAPLASNEYSVIEFTLALSNENLTIYQYKETYHTIDANDSATIILTHQDIPDIRFNYYDWTGEKSWIDYVKISNLNVNRLNDFAYKVQNIDSYTSISLLEKIIQKIPSRVVAYLNLADAYWQTGQSDKAVKYYKKYVFLMDEQHKDMKKIPARVYKRINN